VRRLDLKPRALHRSHLVKNVRFAVQRARVSFDVATRFPARMEMTLDPGAFAVPLIPPSAEVRIEYSDVRLAAPPASAFGAPSGTDARLFAERDTRAGGDGDGLPFELPLGPMFERGYRLNGGRPIAIVDEPGERAYCTCIAHRGDGADGAAVTLRVGNYLSRNMNRRRAWIAENGEPISIGDLRGRRIDRNERWPEGIPRSERPLIELAWEREGIHAFLLGDGVAETDLIEIAQDWAPRIRPRRGSGDQRDAPSE